MISPYGYHWRRTLSRCCDSWTYCPALEKPRRKYKVTVTIQIAYHTPPYSLAHWPQLDLLACSSRGVVIRLLGRNLEMFDVSMSRRLLGN